MFMCVLGRYIASTVFLEPKPFGGGGANSIGGQQRGVKECRPFSDVTSCGRVWRTVPESDARSVRT